MSTTASTKRRPLEKTKTPGIYKREGVYVVVYRDPHGRQRKAFAPTLAEARTVKAARTADVARGEFTQLSRVTFAEYAPQWLSSYKGRTRRGIRPETVIAYARELGFVPGEGGGWRALEPACGAVAFFGSRQLTEIEPRDIKAYAADVERRGVKPNTVRLALAPVKALLATAVEERLIRWNPAAGLRLTNSTEQLGEDGAEVVRAKALTSEQLGELIAQTPADWQLLVRFLAHTGLRISEALALTWADLDLGRRELKVTRRLVKGKLGVPKTRFARRTVRLSPGLAQDLWALRGAPAHDRADDAPVFQRADGRLLDRHRVYHVVNDAGKRAGVPWVGIHTLRHTCATLLFLSGLNAKQVQAWLGHHSASFTLDTYIHLLPGDLPEADFLDALIPVSRGNNGATRATETGRDEPTAAEPETVAAAGLS